MSVKVPHIFVLFAGLVLLCPALAGAITLDKGKWKFTSTSENPMSPQPRIETSIDCVEDNTYDPVKDMTEDGGCTVTDKKETGNSVSWKMTCGGGDGMPPMQGEGSFTSNGNTASGKMTMSFGGMVMNNYWDGEKISNKCDE